MFHVKHDSTDLELVPEEEVDGPMRSWLALEHSIHSNRSTVGTAAWANDG